MPAGPELEKCMAHLVDKDVDAFPQSDTPLLNLALIVDYDLAVDLSTPKELEAATADTLPIRFYALFSRPSRVMELSDYSW